MKFVYGGVLFLIFLIALVFSFRNSHIVEVYVLLQPVRVPLALALAIELLAGVLIGALSRVPHLRKLSSECISLRKRISQLEKELAALRAGKIA